MEMSRSGTTRRLLPIFSTFPGWCRREWVWVESYGKKRHIITVNHDALPDHIKGVSDEILKERLVVKDVDEVSG